MKLKFTLAQIALVLSVFLASETFAQSTFENVHALFQTKCTTGCHSGGSPSGNLNLSGTTADVYSRLVNVNPTNPTATSNGYKRIEPGHPSRSFLLRKINNGLIQNFDLETSEGNHMPDGQPALANHEVELIRQWIIWGAQDTGVVVDEQLVYDYYNGPGIPIVDAPLTPEEEGTEGYQVQYGPFFLAPGVEIEYFQKYYHHLAEDKELKRIKTQMTNTSHHFVLYDMEESAAPSFNIEPVPGGDLIIQAYVYQYSKMLNAWQFSRELVLPEGTAFFHDIGSVTLFNLHIANPNQDSILAATAYVNFYTEPFGSGAVEMHSAILGFGNENPYLLKVPPTNGQPYVEEMIQIVPDTTFYYWTMQAHTHKLGADYDIYLRNPNGTRGEQIYEGFYDVGYEFNQGYFSYSHPPIRKWDEFYPINMDNGLIFEAQWLNPSPDTVGFGFTTEDEMFACYYQYVSEVPTSVEEKDKPVSNMDIYPNPSRDNINLSYTLKNTAHAVVELFNITGSKVKTIINSVQSAGKHLLKIKSADEELAPGTYMVSITVDGEVTTKKVISLN